MAIEKSITVETKDVGPVREKKNKRFSYKPNTVSNGYDPYPNVIPIGPIKHERPWWLNDNDDDEGKLGIESLDVFKKFASAKDDFNFYYNILTRYYTPSDLHGKSLKQLDQMLQMFIKEDGGLI
jgi:hypothetical protein